MRTERTFRLGPASNAEATHSEALTEPQQIAIRVGDYKLPVSALAIANAIPLFLHGKEKWVVDVGKSFNKRVNRGHTDLNIQAHTKGIAYRKIPIIEGAALSYLIDHQLRITESEIAEAFFGTLISALETKYIAIEHL